NASWKILQILNGTVRVEDAHGQPPAIPFWLGEAPARTKELSHAVAALRDQVAKVLSTERRAPARQEHNPFKQNQGPAGENPLDVESSMLEVGCSPTPNPAPNAHLA